MTKITIKAASLEITIDGESQEASVISSVLASLMASIISAAHGEEFVEGTPDAPTESNSTDSAKPAPTEPVNTADVNAENILAFLRNDDQFEYRSYASVNKHFGGSHVDSVLGELVSNGGVTTKRRRADGETLYKAAPTPHDIPGAPAAPEVASIFAIHPVPEVASIFVARPSFNLENLRTFLTSDPRYTRRSLGAIAKHFGVDDEPGLRDTLTAYADEGDIERTTRRRDSMPLYGVA